MNCVNLTISVASFASENIDESMSAQLISESLLAGLYTYDLFKSEKVDNPLKNIKFFSTKVGSDDILRGEKIGSALNIARNMSNDPPNYLTPSKMGMIAVDISENIANMECDVLDRNEMADLGMGSLLGVAQGSV